jgi:outer membrane lipoprotein-sorting protein
MSLFTDHPGARWAVPAAALAVVGAVALTANHVASADPSLPHRSAAQLLVDVQRANLTGLSGTVVQTSNLGLPEINLGGSTQGGSSQGGSSSLTSLVSGTHTWRVWLAGPQQQRLALVGSLGESDVIRNGRDLWVWSSKDKTATHTTLPADSATSGEGATPGPPSPTPERLPKTPQEAAQLALSAIEPTTSVATSGASVVAGQQAYDLVLKPKDAASLVASVRISLDAVHHVPLRVQVFSTKTANPAFEVGFTHVDFAKPAARQFAFNPPPGTNVTQSTLGGDAGKAPATKPAPATPDPAAAKPRVVGTGWTTVVVSRLPDASATGSKAAKGDITGQLERVLSLLPKASGSWGTGRVLQGTLFTVVVTDDGRIAVGAVSPERVYAALAAK